jgi:hypothetical protein
LNAHEEALPVAAEVPQVDSRAPVRKTRPYESRKGAPTARIAAPTTFALSRAQEYAFIREDLRRLLVTAGILVVVMIVLLLAIGG